MKQFFTKENLILSILKYMDKKESKEAVLSNIDEMFKYYHVKKKKVAKIGLKEALYQFLDNKKGMDFLLNQLKSSLCK